MCDPMTFLAIASAGAKGISALGSGFANSELDKFGAQIADTNIKLAKGAGDLAAAKGALDTGRTATAVNQAVSGATAHYGAAGLDPTFGSPLFQQAHSIMQGQGDMAIINARTEAAQASAAANVASATGQKSGYLMKSNNDLMSGYFGAATALLSPGSSDAFKGVQWPWQNGATGNSSIAVPDSFGGE